MSKKPALVCIMNKFQSTSSSSFSVYVLSKSYLMRSVAVFMPSCIVLMISLCASLLNVSMSNSDDCTIFGVFEMVERMSSVVMNMTIIDALQKSHKQRKKSLVLHSARVFR